MARNGQRHGQRQTGEEREATQRSGRQVVQRVSARAPTRRGEEIAMKRLFWPAVSRGWGRRCPHCGIGSLFSGWGHHLERCTVCGLVYERNPGDTWAFTVVGDRLPIALIIGVIYFGVERSH